ncbi:phospholipid/cholesterol/gamma-HCH transport system ATP-binding protein [Mucilaginibacter lappiensis]|uniref:Phospholipid/cholesterol/gamma-HCH transport system ATP-binding protein n=1 Tax=Mucilaginibacter lappiensis TaxID=354630 RepID=A0ABR6PH61_9SPHI|nr:ATP-binding cassette domain-containing protein [Mucilaginibacter lappiensis]MBB6108584.1 phospholipid/cholesterol/gamma-HCH transport system ATP-binding protein [Mucilaginibacter lappiensis]SIQ32082.1 phospholipid/cholesterol/gamma-HCH transport system ATP-binding protein [Mucilaginibacter lappiensis]
MKATNGNISPKKPASTQKDEVVIHAKGIKVGFVDNEVLKNITFDLKRGENMVVLGKSGSGKSVTIQCIVGLLKPDAGDLTVFGQNVAEMNDDELKQLRMKIGFLFQSGALYDSMTVRENLEFPLTRVLKLNDQQEIDKRVEEVLDGVGLLDAIDKLPSDLSGGMRKRVGLARTLIVKPEIMLYDEPTTGLDPITSREISELILNMQKKYKTSSIIITHDMECARITADRIVVMDDGEYIAEGSYKELQKSDNKMVRSFFNETT